MIQYIHDFPDLIQCQSKLYDAIIVRSIYINYYLHHVDTLYKYSVERRLQFTVNSENNRI